MSTDATGYKATLNLPKTTFDMKANLTQREPQRQAQWLQRDLYGQIRQARRGAPVKVLHDGPPYANGEIHMGHLLNKVLKDFVVRWWTLQGYDSPYVPGWDCHGLPIEHKVVRDLGPKARQLDASQIRQLCHEEAMKWVNIQSAQFQRLGVLGDWQRPYLTLDHRYEAGIVDVLADLVEKGYVFRQKKAIHWDIHDRTALAEAELEYQDITSPSIYVLFPMTSGVPSCWGGQPEDWSAMIWTTTPWTLPANLAIAVHPRLDYAGVRYRDPETGAERRVLLCQSLVAKVMAERSVSQYDIVGVCKGADLEIATYRHVFLDRTGRFVLADYVAAEDGTGLVHTAPGHGAEDYRTGLAYGLPAYCPVDESGRYTDDAPDWLRGKGVFEANPLVVQRLKEDGTLFHSAPVRHSYPHGWRSKKPIIFRATEQWFIKVDHNGLRQRVLEQISQVTWLPSWGQRRIEAMVSGRPDWCISRQRAWGVPIPAFRCQKCGHWHMSAATLRHLRDLFRQHGADAWFSRPASELVPPGLTCEACGHDQFDKGSDILDVWFESGASHRAVLSQPPPDGFGLGYPATMYLEGSDQHRGWFQSSILTAVAAQGVAPFQTVLTHGFIVDEQGEKVSKSEMEKKYGKGKVPVIFSAVPATETYGADVLRLYVASMDYADDVRVGETGIKEASEAYRKIRNTFRFLLANLEDYQRFDPERHAPQPSDLVELDRWILGRLNALIRDCEASYNAFEFYRVVQKITQFVNVDLSSFYLDAIKDRLYAELPEGPERRSAQFALFRLHDVLTRLLSPILVHTCEELWERLPGSAATGKPESVHLALAPQPDPRFDDQTLADKWTTLRAVRSDCLRELERLRQSKIIGSSQQGRLAIATADPQLRGLLESSRDALATVCVVSEVEVVADHPEAVPGVDEPRIRVFAAKSPHRRCERCWNHYASVGSDPRHPDLCARCVRVVERLALAASLDPMKGSS